MQALKAAHEVKKNSKDLGKKPSDVVRDARKDLSKNAIDLMGTIKTQRRQVSKRRQPLEPLPENPKTLSALRKFYNAALLIAVHSVDDYFKVDFSGYQFQVYEILLFF